MNTFVAVVFLAACASASVVPVPLAANWNAAAHIPSGSVSVGVNGAVIAGPAGSVATDNGLGGLGASVRLSGPAGEVGTAGGLARLVAPGAQDAWATPIAQRAWAAPAAPIALSASWAAPAWGQVSPLALSAPAWGHASPLALSAPVWGQGLANGW